MIPAAGLPERALADGFARHVRDWADAAGCPEDSLDVVAGVAREVSLATSAGHVCIDLADVAEASRLPDASALRMLLVSSGVFGTPVQPGAHPLVIDDDGRVYLHRYFDFERRLAKRLASGASGGHRIIGPRARELLHGLFAPNAERLQGRPDWQQLATALALEQPVTIISGGPGTGKTTTVVSVLACLVADDPDIRIRLAAPTGKASARMLEAIRAAAARLPEEIRARLPDESFTVHRLLGVRRDTRAFRHGADNPLPIDVLVIDEASMLDLALATRLLEAVPPSARVILLGDKDQLAAVESGAVFAELSADPTLTPACVSRLAEATGTAPDRIAAPRPARASHLRDAVAWLTENFRFARESGIGRLAAAVCAGDSVGGLALLAEGRPDSGLSWLADSGPAPDAALRKRLAATIVAYIEAARAGLREPAPLFAAFGRARVLCAEREGPRGVAAVNEMLAEHFRRSLGLGSAAGGRSPWYPGRPVMILRNDYVLQLFNGDVGITLPGADGSLGVWFPTRDGSFRAVAPVRLPEHETAFATTVHKAQGSEFDEVLLMLPARPNRGVTRELLYTGITRARSRVMVAGPPAVVESAIASPTRRHSGLAARLREATAPG